MNYSIELSREAESDLAEAFSWYNLKRENLGLEFMLSIEASTNSIKRNPNQYQKRYKSVRIAFVNRFPFGIHYIIETRSIKVLAVFHTSQNPQKWETRNL